MSRRRVHDVDIEVEAVLAIAMGAKPEDRFQSTEAFSEAFDAANNGQLAQQFLKAAILSRGVRSACDSHRDRSRY